MSDATSTTPLFLSLLLSLLFTVFVSADQNVTVDDTFGDPITGEQFVYSPTTGSDSIWNVGQTCTGCLAQPDPSQTYNNSWHDGTTGVMTPMSASLSFEGTALYVYCIIAHSAPDSGFRTDTDLSFSIDNEVRGGFYENQPLSDGLEPTYDYNVLVFSIDSLSQDRHQFTMENVNVSLVLLDYVIYTTNNEDIGVPSCSTDPGTTMDSDTVSASPQPSFMLNTAEPTPPSITGVTTLSSSLLPPGPTIDPSVIIDATFIVPTTSRASIVSTVTVSAGPSSSDNGGQASNVVPGAAHSPSSESQSGNSVRTVVIALIAAIVGIVSILAVIGCYRRRRARSAAATRLLAPTTRNFDARSSWACSDIGLAQAFKTYDATASITSIPSLDCDASVRGIVRHVRALIAESTPPEDLENRHSINISPPVSPRSPTEVWPQIPSHASHSPIPQSPGSDAAFSRTSVAADSIASPVSNAPSSFRQGRVSASDRRSMATRTSALTMITIPTIIDHTEQESPQLPARADSIRTIGDRRSLRSGLVIPSSPIGASSPTVDIPQVPILRLRNEFRDSISSRFRVVGPRPRYSHTPSTRDVHTTVPRPDDIEATSGFSEQGVVRR
ncbi:hypothetical protein CERSUDRAFT_102093 [Gelatoporia subvermispora B]|uniref:Uncharacterized protein n=1 Tax=Ceriporiopsis subvermispora (strain B) TaxID=914234 RepID=M2RS00_CERS8|nr:hypothetical protein CERSUDRAFT_102093 [Gelatoporia subvermispora B]